MMLGAFAPYQQRCLRACRQIARVYKHRLIEIFSQRFNHCLPFSLDLTEPKSDFPVSESWTLDDQF